MKKLLSYIILFFVLIFTGNIVYAEKFYIDSYNVDIKVNKDKTVDVTENIDVFFTYPSHGIYRDIQLKPNEEIYNIHVFDKKYSVTKTATNVSIKIGDPALYVKDAQRYSINYKHKLRGSNKEFYYNIIGTEWDVPIHNVSFNVYMPEEFNPEKAGLSIGRFGTKGFNGGAVFGVDGKTISGRTANQGLNPKEGVTLRVELPENYFSVEQDMMPYYILILMIILALISFLIWYMVGKDDHVTPVVSFSPPKNFDSAQVELFYNGSVTEKGLASLIIWLANKGYIRISADDSGHFKFYKEKVLTMNDHGKDVYNFFCALFDNKEEVSDFKLKISKTFYKKCQNCILNYYQQRNKVFEKNSISFGLTFLMFLCLSGIMIFTFYYLFGSFDYLFVSSNPVAPLLIFPVVAILVFFKYIKECPVRAIISSLVFLGIPMLVILQVMPISSDNMSFVFAGIVCLIIAGICFNELPKRTKKANRIYGEILGFKTFLEKVELGRVKALVAENPNYCFDVLPYLYIFGLTDKWIKQFGDFFVQPPQWYSGNNFHRNFSKMMNNTASYTQPSTSNGGCRSSSSGGGGFSGGGSGGGGGRSW